jgi:hypothetical protein
VASQTADLFQAQDSTSAAKFRVVANGDVSAGSLGLGFATPYSGVSNSILGILTAGAANVGISVRGSVSQTANLQTWQNSSGTVLASVNSAGDIQTSTAILAGTAGWLSATLSVRPLNQGIIGQVIRGAASQSANLQEWQSSAGSVLTSIGNTGDLRAPALRTTNDWLVAGNVNSGASIRMERATGTAPGTANQIRLQVLTGTTGLRIVAVGPTGTVVTIADNIT